MKDFLRKYLTLAYLKAHVALVGGALTWYLATYPNGVGIRYVALAVGLLTALGVGVARNEQEDEVLDKAGEIVTHLFPEDDPARRSSLLSTEDEPSGAS